MERWEKPSLVIVAAMWAATFVLMVFSGVSGVPPFLKTMPNWMGLAGFLSLLALLGFVVRMMLQGEEAPFARLRQLDARRGAWVALWMVAAGLHMAAFMSIKPQMNYLVPFWADPLLADLDALLFLGDPYRFLGFLNSPWSADYYSKAWFVSVVATLLWQVCRAPSADKSTNLLAYFAIWASGPIIHLLLPAGGPIFYEALGHGGRFEALVPPPETRATADYLWRTYLDRTFALGAGISAMPSLHIATVTWIALCCRGTRLFVPSCLFGLSIFALSVSLGWHYALDGIVGALLALAMVSLLRRRLSA